MKRKTGKKVVLDKASWNTMTDIGIDDGYVVSSVCDFLTTNISLRYLTLEIFLDTCEYIWEVFPCGNFSITHTGRMYQYFNSW